MAKRRSFTLRDRRVARPSPLLIALSVLGLAGIVYATLCPIGLRPHFADANEERFCAFFVLGLLVALAAGRRWMTATVLVVLVAFGLDALQMLALHRDPRIADALVKAVGGIAGSGLGHVAYALRRQMQRLFGGRKVVRTVPVRSF